MGSDRETQVLHKALDIAHINQHIRLLQIPGGHAVLKVEKNLGRLKIFNEQPGRIVHKVVVWKNRTQSSGLEITRIIVVTIHSDDW